MQIYVSAKRKRTARHGTLDELKAQYRPEKGALAKSILLASWVLYQSYKPSHDDN
jgi:hypothetical protein